MKTLYDVLGVSRQATAEQIEQNYQFSMNALLNGENSSHEATVNLAKALKEAYAVLSSPSRRQSYDLKLNTKKTVTYQVVEKKGLPWVTIGVLSFLLLGVASIYKYQVHKVEVEQAKIAADKAQAEADAAANLAAAEQARLEQQKNNLQRQDDWKRQREMEIARAEARMNDAQLQRFDAQLARDKANADQQARNAEMMAKLQRQREDQMAVLRARSDDAALQRALNMPIPRH